MAHRAPRPDDACPADAEDPPDRREHQERDRGHLRGRDTSRRRARPHPTPVAPGRAHGPDASRHDLPRHPVAQRRAPTRRLLPPTASEAGVRPTSARGRPLICSAILRTEVRSSPQKGGVRRPGSVSARRRRACGGAVPAPPPPGGPPPRGRRHRRPVAPPRHGLPRARHRRPPAASSSRPRPRPPTTMTISPRPAIRRPPAPRARRACRARSIRAAS